MKPGLNLDTAVNLVLALLLAFAFLLLVVAIGQFMDVKPVYQGF